MSKRVYDIVDGCTRRVYKQYAVIDRITRPISRNYIVRGGVTHLTYLRNPFGSYSGEYTEQTIISAGKTYLLYTLLTDGMLKIYDTAACWICGGGGGGAGNLKSRDYVIKNGSKVWYPAVYGGGGGGGGYFADGDLSAGEYAVTIGEGGAPETDGQDSYIYTMDNQPAMYAGGGKCGTVEKGGNGGSPGGGGGYEVGDGSTTIKDGNNPSGKGAGVSTVPFGLAEYLEYPCAGGGGGSAGGSGQNGYCGGSDGLEGSTPGWGVYPTPGGETGGGTGGLVYGNGQDATYFGGGGGGGGTQRIANIDSYKKTYGGKGYQGVAFLLFDMTRIKDTAVLDAAVLDAAVLAGEKE